MNQIITTNADHHIPWNKGKLIGQKSPVRQKRFGLTVFAFNWRKEHENWHYPIWLSIANYASVMMPKVTEFRREP
jgi:hypothetical protein